MKIPPRIKIILLLLFGICTCLAVILLTGRTGQRKHPDEVYLRLLRQAYENVARKYVEKPDSKKLVESMVVGMLAALDPHSAYLPPEPFREMEVQMAGAFGGVGIELGSKDGKLVVVAPIDDTPASRAGIQANDHIWKIDGVLTRGMAVGDAVKRMRGEKGTPVTLTLVRAETPQPIVVNLIRDIIRIKSTRSQQVAHGIGYIRISQFQQRTGEEFKQALQQLHATAGGQMGGLIIDLRYNPGGIIDAAVEVAGCFIGEDISRTEVVSIKGRTKESTRVYNARVGTKEPVYPVVILINGGSASASEILAGALQDHKRALVLGQQSFGKGSVQSIIPLKDKGALKLTTARYYTPGGRSIQARGITPDIVVSRAVPAAPKDPEPDGKERDLVKSLPAEGKVEQPAARPESPHGPPKGEADPAKDQQLKRAIEVIQSMHVIRSQGLAH